MANLSGLFDSFDNLDQIDINSLVTWFKNVTPNPIQLENYLANRILYPKSVSTTPQEMEIDLAILREALRLNGPKPGPDQGGLLGENPFLNITLRKIIIPENFLKFAPDLVSLTWAFVDGLLLGRRKDLFEDLWTVVVADDAEEIVGSVLLPKFQQLGVNMTISLMGKEFKIKSGSLTHLPCTQMRCEIAYKVDKGMILGKQQNAVEIYGGRLGLIIDGRMQ